MSEQNKDIVTSTEIVVMAFYLTIFVFFQSFLSFKLSAGYYFSACMLHTNLHIVFEDVSSSRHVYNVVDDEFTESCKQVSPLMESLDLVGFILLISLCRHKDSSGQQ